MKIKEFIQGRNVSYDTVRRYISNHPELFKGHIGRPNNVILDDYAVQLLHEKYPFPEPVQIIEDTAAQQELADLKDKMLLLYEKCDELIFENAELKLMQQDRQLLAEDNNRLQEQIKMDKERIDWQNRMIKAQNKKLKELLEEIKVLEEENAKPWWKRIGRK